MKKILLALLVTFTVAQAKEGGVVYVDFERIYRESKVVSAVRDDINVEFRDREEKLKDLSDKIRSINEELEKESLTLSEGEKEAQRREVAEMERGFIRDRRALSEDLGVRFQEHRRIIDAEIERLIEKLAKEKAYGIVLNPYIILPFSGDRTLTHNVILYAADDADITEEVIELFDQEAKISR